MLFEVMYRCHNAHRYWNNPRITQMHGVLYSAIAQKIVKGLTQFITFYYQIRLTTVTIFEENRKSESLEFFTARLTDVRRFYVCSQRRV